MEHIRMSWRRLWRTAGAFAVAVVLAAVSTIRSAPPRVPLQSPRGYFFKDDAELAKQTRIDPARIQMLRERRSLTNSEILLLSKSPPKFQRALRRARFQDLPAVRAAFRALQQADEHGKV